MDSTGFKLPRESPDAAFAKERFPRQVFASTPQRHKTHTLAHAQRPAVINDTTAGRPLAHARTAQPRATPTSENPTRSWHCQASPAGLSTTAVGERSQTSGPGMLRPRTNEVCQGVHSALRSFRFWQNINVIKAVTDSRLRQLSLGPRLK